MLVAALSTSCGLFTGSISKSDLESKAHESLQKSVGSAIGDTTFTVKCPHGLKAKAKESVKCKLSTSDGYEFFMTSTVKSVKDSKVNLIFKVDDVPSKTPMTSDKPLS